MVAAETVARAIVAAARVCGQDPLRVLLGEREYGKSRVMAGAILVRAGACSAAVAARLCGAPTPQKLSPTGRRQYGIDEADFNRAVAWAALEATPVAPRSQYRAVAGAQPIRREGKAPCRSLREPQMDAIETYLRSVADKDGCVRGKNLPAIAAGSGVPLGSVHFSLRSLEEAKRIIIAKAFKPGTMCPLPNSYWLSPSDPQPSPPAPPTRPERRQTDPVFSAAFEGKKPGPGAAPRAVIARPQALLPPPRPATEADFEIEAPAVIGPATLMQLRARQCRWPLEDSPTGASQLYCAAPAGDGQYCKGHLARMWAKPPKRESKPLADAERDRRTQAARDRRTA